jgi:diacylglycerol kinase (ATP)
MSETNEKMKALFIVNPFSGVGRQKAIERHLAGKLNHKLFDYEVKYTERPHHATELCHDALQQNVDLIVAVGGDGTVNETARLLIGRETLLGIIPSGSGNGLARHLRIPLETDKAIEVLNGMKVKKIDAVEANDQFFFSIAGVGFDAFVAKKFAGQKKRGFMKYAQIATEEYPNYKPKKFTLEIDGRKFKRRALFISFANSDQFGYNTSISPQAKIDDGLIDICIMKKVPLWQTVFLAPLFFLRLINKSPFIEIIRAREVDIKQKNNYLNLDGEAVKVNKRLHIKVIPQAINIIVPEKRRQFSLLPHDKS